MAHLAEWRERHPRGLARLFLIVPSVDAVAEQAEAIEVARKERSTVTEPIAITWEKIADIFEAVAGDTSERTKVHLEDFAAVVRRRLGDALRPLSAEESELLNDNLVGKLLQLAQRYAERIAEELRGRGLSPRRTS
jgi:hypothetical protein